MAEASPHRITDQITTLQDGVHEGRNPSLLKPSQAARLINATVRGGFATCRPPWVRFPLNFQDGEQAYWFLTNNVQGRAVYRSPLGNTSIVASVGGRIFKIDVSKPKNTNVIELTTSGDANPSVRPHVWMCQAEKYLIIQDGQSTPLIYDGAVCRRSSLGDPLYEVPVGKAMCYGLGRLVVVRPHGRSYVIGDIVNGGTEVIQFTEDNYLNEGGDITVPIQGEITAVSIMAQIDRSVGQGDLVVFTPYGAATARIGEKRSTWKDIQFQLVALLGAGATSHNSVIPCNGDLFYRRFDGIGSLAMSRREFQASWATTPLSREVSVTLSYDTPHLLDFCESVLFDNRLLVLCNQTPLVNGCYHRGIVSLDFELISSMGEKSPPAYDGLWTGLKLMSIVSGDFNGTERCFGFHKNSDGQTELWELLKEGYLDDNTNRIEWVVEGASILRGDVQSLKTIDSADYSLEDVQGRVSVNLKYKPDSAPCWYDWGTHEICATMKNCNAGCTQPVQYQPQYRTKKRFGQPPDDCSESDNKPARNAYEFRPRLKITGKATLNSIRIHAYEKLEDLTGCDASE